MILIILTQSHGKKHWKLWKLLLFAHSHVNAVGDVLVGYWTVVGLQMDTHGTSLKSTDAEDTGQLFAFIQCLAFIQLLYSGCTWIAFIDKTK